MTVVGEHAKAEGGSRPSSRDHSRYRARQLPGGLPSPGPCSSDPDHRREQRDEDPECPGAARDGRPIHHGRPRARIRHGGATAPRHRRRGPPPRRRSRRQRQWSARPAGGWEFHRPCPARIRHGLLRLHEREVPRRGPRDRDGCPLLVSCPRARSAFVRPAVDPDGPRRGAGVQRHRGPMALGRCGSRWRREPRDRRPPVHPAVPVRPVPVCDLGHPRASPAHLGGDGRPEARGLRAGDLSRGRSETGAGDPRHRDPIQALRRRRRGGVADYGRGRDRQRPLQVRHMVHHQRIRPP